jgi:hypothetical protein
VNGPATALARERLWWTDELVRRLVLHGDLVIEGPDAESSAWLNFVFHVQGDYTRRMVGRTTRRGAGAELYRPLCPGGCGKPMFLPRDRNDPRDRCERCWRQLQAGEAVQ